MKREQAESKFNSNEIEDKNSNTEESIDVGKYFHDPF